MIIFKNKLLVMICGGLTAGLAAGGSGLFVARAQMPTSRSVQDFVYETSDRNLEVENELINYRHLIKDFQSSEDEFMFSRSAYQQLGTLASLEELVQAARSAMITQDEVVVSYLKLIRLYLVDTYGIDLNSKQITVTQIETLTNSLISHQETTRSILTKDQVDQQADSFEPLLGQAIMLQSRVDQLVKVGRLQAAYDKINTVVDEVQLVVDGAEISKTKSEEKQRAMNQVAERQLTVEQLLADFNYLIINPQAARPTRGEREKAEINPANLQSLYAQMHQILTYLDEIVRDI